jgi:hypothetical protein
VGGRGNCSEPSSSQVKQTRKVKPLPNVDKGKTHIYEITGKKENKEKLINK